MKTATGPITGVYRPGYPFTGAELQALTGQGVLRHMLADVYAETSLPGSAAVRATAASALLSRTLRGCGVLCGETAAWVHLGAEPPDRSSIITGGVYRRPASGSWRIYQVPLAEDEVLQIGPMPVTTAARTAADIYCGVGTSDSRRSLSQLVSDPQREDQLRYWPESADPLYERDHRIWERSAADQQRLNRRMDLIGELIRCAEADCQDVVDKVMRILGISRPDGPCAVQTESLLAQCVSRRLPTLR